VITLTKRRCKRTPLPVDLLRSEFIYQMPEHELACVYGCRKYTIGEEISEQLGIVPMH
jgi:transposase